MAQVSTSELIGSYNRLRQEVVPCLKLLRFLQTPRRLGNEFRKRRLYKQLVRLGYVAEQDDRGHVQTAKTDSGKQMQSALRLLRTSGPFTLTQKEAVSFGLAQ